MALPHQLVTLIMFMEGCGVCGASKEKKCMEYNEMQGPKINLVLCNAS